MAYDSVSDGDTAFAADVQQILDGITGTSTQAHTFHHDSVTEYAFTVQQDEDTAALAMRVRNAANTRNVLDVKGDRVYANSGLIFSPELYGAVAGSTTSAVMTANVTAVNNAVAAARTAAGVVEFGYGAFHFNSPLNWTELQDVCIRGARSSDPSRGTRLYFADVAANRATPLIDMAGSTYSVVENMLIGTNVAWTSASYPTVMLLVGAAAHESAGNILRNLVVGGTCLYALVIGGGVSITRVENCNFTTAAGVQVGRPVVLSATAADGTAAGTGAYGSGTSPFGIALSGQISGAAYWATVEQTQFVNCQFAQGYTTTGVAGAIYLDGARHVSFYDCDFTGGYSGVEVHDSVRSLDAAATAQNRWTKNITLVNCYAHGYPVGSDALESFVQLVTSVGLTGAGVTAVTSYTLVGLTMLSARAILDTGKAWIATAAAGENLSQVYVFGLTNQAADYPGTTAATTNLLVMTGTSATDGLTHSVLHCQGLDLTVNGNIARSVRLLGEGTVTTNGGVRKDHNADADFVARCYVTVATSTPTLVTGSVNVTSVAYAASTGVYDITLTSGAGTTYSVTAMPGTACFVHEVAASRTATNIRLAFVDAAGAAINPVAFNLMVHGVMT